MRTLVVKRSLARGLPSAALFCELAKFFAWRRFLGAVRTTSLDRLLTRAAPVATGRNLGESAEVRSRSPLKLRGRVRR